MCAVSAVMDYGRGMDPNSWDDATRDAFEKLVREAMDFDKKTGQPDCEDPEKMKWWKAIEEVK